MWVRKKLQTVARLLVRDRRRLLHVLTGRIYKLQVFSELTANILPPQMISNVECRKLSDAELREAARSREELQVQEEHLDQIGESAAYGVYRNGQLAHISWLITPPLDRRRAIRHIKLRPGEGEIAACVTLPEHRGFHLYPFAIQTLCAVAKEAGVRRVFMTTGDDNVASQKGILRAGLRPFGEVIRIVLPLLPSHSGIHLRGRRLRGREVSG